MILYGWLPVWNELLPDGVARFSYWSPLTSLAGDLPKFQCYNHYVNKTIDDLLRSP